MVPQDSRLPFRRLWTNPFRGVYSGLRSLETTWGAKSGNSEPCPWNRFSHCLLRPSSLRFRTRCVFPFHSDPATIAHLEADWSSSRVMASITTMLPDQCTVLRDGTSQNVVGTQIVPGDVLFLKMGDKVPTNVRFVDVSTDAKFDRSILTGMPEASLTESGLPSDCNTQASLCLCTAQLIQQTATTSRQHALGWLELMSLRAAP